MRIKIITYILLFVNLYCSAQQKIERSVGQIYNNIDTLIFENEYGVSELLNIPYFFESIEGQVADVSLDTCNATLVNFFTSKYLNSAFDNNNCTHFSCEEVCVGGILFTECSVFPYFKRDDNWFFAKNFTISYSQAVGRKKSANADLRTSVLASGQWRKVRISQSGMKKLTSSALAQMGFNDISKIAIYGNGGAELPYANSAVRPVDLVKIPVYKVNNALLFYAQGVENWSFSSTADNYSCAVHPSDQYSYYYITETENPSEQPSVVDYSGEEATDVKTVYDSRAHHELRNRNLIASGRDWFGESFSMANPSMKFSLDLPTRADASDPIKLSTKLAARSAASVAYAYSVEGNSVTAGFLSAAATTSTTGDYATAVTRNTSFTPTNLSKTEISLEYTFNSATDGGWLDYITVSSTAKLDMSNKSELMFRHRDSRNNKGVINYKISNATSSTKVLDITDCTNPKEVAGAMSSATLSFNYKNGELREFVAFDTTGDFEEPVYVGAVANQNLHSIEPVNYVIITHPDFEAQAERLAEFHRTHSELSVEVVRTDAIYNEFSSGKVEVAAIRDFLKMIYDRSAADDENGLRYALLFGDGSYDNMTISSDNVGNKIPTYQSAQSLNQSQTYVTDDFFGWLDDKEGGTDLSSRMDIGIGRFPVQTTAEAESAVNKSVNYITKSENSEWKSRIAVVADDGDKNEHVGYAEKLTQQFEELHPEMTMKRIYLEAYTQEKTSTGISYPQAIKDFEEAINNGSLVIDYVGHGGATGLTDEGLFKQSFIKNWTNENKLPFFITATCDFSPFDHKAMSSGEESLLYEHGGFIGLFTTTRLVYGNSNFTINKAFNERLLERDEAGRRYTVGEASCYAKAKTGNLVNSLKYVLLADPAITLLTDAEYEVVTDSVNGQPYSESTIPIAALKVNSICGSVRDENGNVDDTFNGQVVVNVYDKINTMRTSGLISQTAYEYQEYATLLYRGTVTVENGQFSTQFILSKDINFGVGFGRVTYYATSLDEKSAAGASNAILVGGISDGIATDTVGPKIVAWIDYPEFVDGSETGKNPFLYATIADESGINYSGTGVGHDITLWMNGERNNSISLNSYFKNNIGSYTDGVLKYQLSTLTDGKYTLTLKAWDNQNNSSEVDLNFVVKENSGIRFGSTELYPSPLRSQSQALKLRFNHNDGNTALNIRVLVYSATGKLMISKSIVKTTTETQTDEVVLNSDIPEINQLSNGLYLVKVEVTGTNGRSGSFTKKLSVRMQ